MKRRKQQCLLGIPSLRCGSSSHYSTMCGRALWKRESQRPTDARIWVSARLRGGKLESKRNHGPAPRHVHNTKKREKKPKNELNIEDSGEGEGLGGTVYKNKKLLEKTFCKHGTINRSNSRFCTMHDDTSCGTTLTPHSHQLQFVISFFLFLIWTFLISRVQNITNEQFCIQVMLYTRAGEGRGITNMQYCTCNCHIKNLHTISS